MALLNIGFSAEATGTPDVITATYTPAITLSDRRIVFLRILTPNEGSTVTFNPNSLGAHPVKRFGGDEIFPRDLSGDCILMYNEFNEYWELINPKISKYLTAGDDNAYAYDRVVEGGVWEASAGDDNGEGTITIQPEFSRISHDDEVQLNGPSVTKNGDEVATETFVTTGLLFKQNTLTSSNTGALVNGFTSKATPIDADQFLLTDSAAGTVAKKITWANIKATLTTLFNTAYVSLTGSYVDPSWINSLAWSKITGTPTTLTGYGITDAVWKFCKTNDSTTHTGTTNNTIVYSHEITGNTLIPGDAPEIIFRNKYIGGAGTKTTRIYLNSSNSLTSASLIGTFNVTAASMSLDMSKIWAIKSATETEVSLPTVSVATRESSQSTLPTVYNIDWTQSVWVIVAVQLANATDSAINSYFKLTK